MHFANAFKETPLNNCNLTQETRINGFHAGEIDQERMGRRGGPGFPRRAADLPAHKGRISRRGHCAQLQSHAAAVHENRCVRRNARPHVRALFQTARGRDARGVRPVSI